MADRLFLGPLRGREPGLIDACSGYLANPMVQPLANRLPLASVAAFVRGDDPDVAWREAAGDLGWLAFAEACDTDAAREVVRVGDWRAARSLFATAAACAAPGIEDEAQPWLTQVHRDARLALQALDVLEGERSIETVMGMAARWQASRRAAVTVFGPRCSLRPVFGQSADDTWQVERAAITADENAIDDLVRAALAVLSPTSVDVRARIPSVNVHRRWGVRARGPPGRTRGSGRAVLRASRRRGDRVRGPRARTARRRSSRGSRSSR